MKERYPRRSKRRIVKTPASTDPSIPNSIFSIEVNEDEEVEWQWLNLPDGHRVVTRYKVFKMNKC